MIKIIFGAFMLSIVHAMIPNHWIPLVTIARAEKWSRNEALLATGYAGLAHTLSTILIGIIIGLIGHELSEKYAYAISIVAPSILVLLGIIYLVLGAGHSHHDFSSGLKKPGGKRKTSIIITLALAMFFSPCLEIEAYYFTAGISGWTGIVAVSATYLIVTISGMLILVEFGLKGAKRIRSHFLEHHEKKLTGTILIVLGILSYFFKV